MGARAIEELDLSLDLIRASPRDVGTIELIARRPAENERELVDEAELDLTRGLVGDMWSWRKSRRTPDGSPNPDQQLTLMSARAITAIAGDRAEWPRAGDQLYVDLDLSTSNLPPGSRLVLGSAVVEITAVPHTGCAKFAARFGIDAQRWVNTPVGRELRLRGVNARVVVAGRLRRGDSIRKLDQ
ncbi:MAG TPA: MOSC domain-containing protein [Polyangia bacterium]|nr:MOSC domain-containing protein [Polyangia bacterium]